MGGEISINHTKYLRHIEYIEKECSIKLAIPVQEYKEGNMMIWSDCECTEEDFAKTVYSLLDQTDSTELAKFVKAIRYQGYMNIVPHWNEWLFFNAAREVVVRNFLESISKKVISLKSLIN